MPETDLPSKVQNGEMPDVLTSPAIDVSLYKATLSGKVETGNGYDISLRGFVIDTLNTPQTTGNTIDCGNGKGIFSKDVTNLLPGKTYYAMAFAKNDLGTSYGEIISFNTETGRPTVITEPVKTESITDGTAICSGKILSVGSAPITRSGICWGTNENPMIEKNDSVADSDDFGSMEFSTKLKNIKGSHKCYFRAFAKNQYGTEYGEVLNFDTPFVWEKMSDFTGFQRIFAASFTLDNNFYIITGKGADGDDSPGPLQDSRTYKPGVNKWETKTPLASARSGAIGFNLGNYGYIGFGQTSGGYQKDLYQFNPVSDEWRSVQDDSTGNIFRLVYAAAFSLNNNGYVVGGYTGSPDGNIITDKANEVWKCSIYEVNDQDTLKLKVKWEKMGQPFPVKTWRHIAFTYNDRVFVGLGNVNNSENKSRIIYEYNANNDSWSEFTTLPADFIFGEYGTQVAAATIIDKGIAYFIGRRQIWGLNLNSKKWEAKSLMPSAYYGNIMFALDKEIYVGINSDTREFYKYRPLWDN